VASTATEPDAARSKRRRPQPAGSWLAGPQRGVGGQQVRDGVGADGGWHKIIQLYADLAAA
jgi:hypothetical protein